MFALDLDGPVDHTTARPTALLQRLGQRLERRRRQPETREHTHAFAATTGGLASHPNGALLGGGGGQGRPCLASAGVRGKPTTGADPAGSGGINNARFGRLHGKIVTESARHDPAPPVIDNPPMALIDIQPARRGDATALALLSRRLVEAGLDPAWTDRRIEQARQNDDSRVFVARRGQGIVGGAILEFLGGAAHLSLLVVDPQVQRTGLGRRLMAECEHAARVAGCHRMELEVREGNRPALAFYQACGYRTSHQRDGYYGPTESAVCLTRDLG